MSLSKQVAQRMKRQQSVMQYMQSRSGESVEFGSVDVSKKKGPQSDKDKGVIKPPVNYIEDEAPDGQVG